MHCPFCGHIETKVNDSRLAGEGRQIRRRRECLKCGERFTTFETAELLMPLVIKGDRGREAFDEGKLRAGMEKALEKRPVPREQIDEAISRIVHKVRTLGDREVTSRAIGELVMEELRHLDEVAYVRFASVYRQFEDVEAFHEEIQRLRSARAPAARTPRRRACTSARRAAARTAISCRCCPRTRRPTTPIPAQAARSDRGTVLRFRPLRHAACAGARRTRARDHRPEPARRLRHRAARPHHRRGLARARRRGARGNRGAARRRRRGCGRGGLRHARALQPPRPHAAVRRGARSPPRVARVVYAAADPNPLVNGRGAAALRAAGIAVEAGLMEQEAAELNAGFFKRMQQGRPLVRVKLAMSLDGRTALANGESRWITGEAARSDVQHWRARSSAVLTGVGTVLADDPRLDVRLPDAAGRARAAPAAAHRSRYQAAHPAGFTAAADRRRSADPDGGCGSG